MTEAKDRAAWNRTFAVVAQLSNVNRDPQKTTAIDIMRFFPWSLDVPKAAPPPTDSDRKALRKAYPGRKE